MIWGAVRVVAKEAVAESGQKVAVLAAGEEIGGNNGGGDEKGGVHHGELFNAVESSVSDSRVIFRAGWQMGEAVATMRGGRGRERTRQSLDDAASDEAS